MEGELVANFFISETKLPDQKFFLNIRQRDFDSAAQDQVWSL